MVALFCVSCWLLFLFCLLFDLFCWFDYGVLMGV